MRRLIQMLSVGYIATFLAISCIGAADDGADLVQSAFQAKERGQFLVAIRLFDEALRDEERSKEQRGLLRYGRGSSYMEIGMNDAALADLDRRSPYFLILPAHMFIAR
jgi:hypothetical protein